MQKKIIIADMKQPFRLLLLLLVLTLGCPASAGARDLGELRRDEPVFAIPGGHDAVLSSARETFRLCSERPRQFSPVGMRRVQPSAERLFQHSITRFKVLSAGRGKPRCSSPFLPDAHGDYFVFALRHLLC